MLHGTIVLLECILNFLVYFYILAVSAYPCFWKMPYQRIAVSVSAYPYPVSVQRRTERGREREKEREKDEYQI